MAWDALYEAQPTDSTYVADTDDAIRSTKTEIRTRVAKEHGFNLSESAPQTGHGKHLRGSARAFVSDTSVADPTTVTADDADYGTGRLQVYPTLKRLGYYSGSAWVDLIRNSSGQLFSEVATGTAPMVVASTTKVSNLNSHYVEGHATGESNTSIGGTSAAANIGLIGYIFVSSSHTMNSMLVGEMRFLSSTLDSTITLPSSGTFIVIRVASGETYTRYERFTSAQTFSMEGNLGAFVVRVA